MLPLITTMFVGFVIGAVTVIGFEILGFVFILRKLNRKAQQENIKMAQSLSSGPHEFDFSYPNKQGFVWILEKEKLPKSLLTDKGSRQRNYKKEILEVSPVWKYAEIKDKLLIFTESDGSHIEIPLMGCTIAAVSATSLSSSKWAKRYPIKVESKTSVAQNVSKSFYMYLETSWEKESWCKALRLASGDEKEKLWFFNLHSEFHSYLTSLNIEYPSFLKPSTGFNPDIIDRSIKIDGSSKVRDFLKKLAKKASKSGVENKANWTSISGREERKISEKSGSMPESISAGSSAKPAQTGKVLNYVVEENTVPSSLPAFTHSSSRSQFLVNSDTDSVDKITSDEGTLCWNLLISRLFFDAKSNAEMKSSMQARIQRMLSNMRSPSYVGEVTCTGVDPGNLPPYIHAMRVLPSDMKEVVAMEIDFEYRGGAVLDIETRLEVRDPDLPESMGTNSDSSSVGEVTTDILEGFENVGKQLTLSEPVNDMEQKADGNPKLDEISSKSNAQTSSNVSRWKSILNSVAKQVSQVPLSLGIRVAALRGTLRLHIKPPPSDQLWFGFTSMPHIDFNLESSVGDRKITSGHIALFLISRFKAAIRETMILPNCESICIPWMLGEKDDWVPLKVAPFIWINQEESFSEPTIPPSQPSEEIHVHEAPKVTTTQTEGTQDNAKKVEPLDKSASSSGPVNDATLNENPLQELRTPLLGNHDEQPQAEKTDAQSPSREHTLLPQSLILAGEQNNGTVDGDDARPRRMGGSTRARMLGLGKKMSEKLDEKRRNIEERGRHIVERMRGP